MWPTAVTRRTPGISLTLINIRTSGDAATPPPPRRRRCLVLHVTKTINYTPTLYSPLIRTVQEVDGGGTAVIDQCAEVIGITQAGSGDYELSDPNALYPLATDGDICLIQQFNFQVEVSDAVYMQLQEVFYIYNDPILSRPR